MEAGFFVNHYETLGVSPDADLETIESRFRHLARRYHPDNQATGDRARFEAVLAAHDTLRDPDKRARYHSDFLRELGASPPTDGKVGESAGVADRNEAANGGAIGDSIGIERDIDIQNRLLTTLYLKRRSNIKEPGMGDAELEMLSGCPENHLEFHLWYLKEKGWVARADDGLIVITVDGVDRAAVMHQSETKRITDRT